MLLLLLLLLCCCCCFAAAADAAAAAAAVAAADAAAAAAAPLMVLLFSLSVDHRSRPLFGTKHGARLLQCGAALLLSNVPLYHTCKVTLVHTFCVG